MAKKSETGPLSKRMAHIDETLREQAQNKKGTEAVAPAPKRVCSIEGCRGEVERSLSIEKYESILKQANLKMRESKIRRLYVCHDHYKLLKKYTKKETKAAHPKFEKKSDTRAFSSKVKRLDWWVEAFTNSSCFFQYILGTIRQNSRKIHVWRVIRYCWTIIFWHPFGVS